MPKLSICIPTRNREVYLIECLDNILSQCVDDIEIVIVDGASTDNTNNVVERYKNKFANLTYFKRDKCIGVDRDILEAVKISKGEFCWLMSDDDLLEQGAIRHILECIYFHEPIAGISVNYTAYDSKMKFKIETVPAISGNKINNDFLFTDANKCFSNLGVHLGFLSAQIVNRNFFLKTVSKINLDNYCNSWLLVYIIGRMFELESKWLYVHRKLVKYRSGNDSFLITLGVYNRQLITYVNFPEIIQSIFGYRTEAYDNVMYTLVADRMARSLAVIKADGTSVATQLKIFFMYFKKFWYFPLFWYKVFPVFFIPNFVLRFIRYYYMRSKGLKFNSNNQIN
jgi:glycosyltransferase involved in cell wall biosynthesis